MTISVIPESTVQAYRSTLYWVRQEPPFALRVGVWSPELGRLFQANGVTCGAFLTAWNPCGVEAPMAENASANAKMVGQLEAGGKRVVPGFRVAEDGSAPGEESALALDVSLEEARQIGTDFKQNAIIWIGEDLVPELILLR